MSMVPCFLSSGSCLPLRIEQRDSYLPTLTEPAEVGEMPKDPTRKP